MTTRPVLVPAVTLGLAATLAACGTIQPNRSSGVAAADGVAPANQTSEIPSHPLTDAVDIALQSVLKVDPGLIEFQNASFAMAIFPFVATEMPPTFSGDDFNSRGLVFVDGVQFGEVRANVGDSPMPAAFSQIVFFETEEDFNRYFADGSGIDGEQPSFPVVPSVSEQASFVNGLAVFTSPGQSGQAPYSAGEQSFTFFSEF
ncbi:MAG: hypothetical protein AAF108_05220 [Planctomycetota bacterium]